MTGVKNGQPEQQREMLLLSSFGAHRKSSYNLRSDTLLLPRPNAPHARTSRSLVAVQEKATKNDKGEVKACGRIRRHRQRSDDSVRSEALAAHPQARQRPKQVLFRRLRVLTTFCTASVTRSDKLVAFSSWSADSSSDCIRISTGLQSKLLAPPPTSWHERCGTHIHRPVRWKEKSEV